MTCTRIFFTATLKLLFLLSVIFTAGCSTTQKNKDFDLIATSGPWAIDGILADPKRLHERDARGRTLLHEAALRNSTMIEPLLQGGLDINAVDQKGMTAFHYAVWRNEKAILPLLKHNPDLTLKSKGPTRCSGMKKVNQGLTALELLNYCGRESSRRLIAEYQLDTQAWQNAQQQNTHQGYDIYLSHYPSGIYYYQAVQKRDDLLLQLEAELEANQPCGVNDSEYYLIAGACENGMAHGKGEAKTVSGKRFAGEFNYGLLHHGKMYVEDDLVWDGPVENAVPHGKGVCRYDNEMEVCETYEGKRIDALFKQRQLMVKQMEMMESQMASLRHEVRSSSYNTPGTTVNRDDYMVDLFSNDKNKRTAAQVRAAVDLFSFLVKNARKRSN